MASVKKYKGPAVGKEDMMHDDLDYRPKKHKVRRCPVCQKISSEKAWVGFGDSCPKCGHRYPAFP